MASGQEVEPVVPTTTAGTGEAEAKSHLKHPKRQELCCEVRDNTLLL